MMGDQISMALDDIIKANRMEFQRGGGGVGRRFINTRYAGGRGSGGWFRYGRTGSFARGGNRGGIFKSAHYSRGNVNSVWSYDTYNVFDELNSQTADVTDTTYADANTAGPTKLLISNLDFGVSGSDIRELFSEYGSLKSAAIHYDRSGRSLGTADVVFERGADAWKAMKVYNGVPLDGKPMSVQLATSERADINLGNDLRTGIGGGSSGGGGPVWGNINRVQCCDFDGESESTSHYELRGFCRYLNLWLKSLLRIEGEGL